MQKYILIISFLCFISCTQTKKNNIPDYDFVIPFEKSEGTETSTYEETIAFYQHLAQTFDAIDIKDVGITDSGLPLHIVTLNPDQEFDFDQIRANKRIILINNGIHPGESDGIDATMMLFRDIVLKKIKVPTQTTLVTIPIYNIGGALNRNSSTRTNQNGPAAYGFRGNSRNYDLNRDFIKNDTKNAQTFAKIFHLVKPDVFIDNHVSNGADYQYTLTHLLTQHNKLGGKLGKYLNSELRPQLETSLQNKDWDITPYVNVWGTTPDEGWSQFIDTPRYSTGYTTLWNTLGLMVETHMLKPYKKRVTGTYELLKSMIDVVEKDGTKIRTLRNNAFASQAASETYPIQWKIDTTRVSKFKFKGFEGNIIDSKITGAKRLKYNQNAPFVKEVNYQNYCIASKAITVPKAYVIPKGWWNIITMLKQNDIEFSLLKNDSTITVETYKIEEYKTRNAPFEGHYLHYDVTLSKKNDKITFKKGDIIVPTDQEGFRYLIEVLEPEAVDSFFNWNFFDTILQQKEGFSPYVWEDKALELLNKNTELKSKFEQKKKDTAFANNWYAQLGWIHKQSDHYEKAHLRYPVFRILK